MKHHSDRILKIATLAAIIAVVFYISNKSFGISDPPDPNIEIVEAKPLSYFSLEAIKAMIISENPRLKEPNLTDFEKTNILRQWVFDNVPFVYPEDSDWLASNHYNVKSPSNISLTERLHLYLNGLAGSYCAGTATTLAGIYELFGFKSYIINSGDSLGLWSAATHVVTLVEIIDKGKTTLVVQDAYLNRTFINANNDPLDYFDLIAILKKRQTDLIANQWSKTILKPRLILANKRSLQMPTKVFTNGNIIILEEFSAPDFDRQTREFLNHQGYPQDIVYLLLFPFGAHGNKDNYEKAQDVLRRAQDLIHS